MDYGHPPEEVPAFSLTILSGGESGQRFTFAQPEVTLGRIADNDLVLYDAAVSRRHLVVYFRNNQFILEDLGSSNGTLLNGNPITQPTVLCERDLLDVGSVRFQFSSDSEAAYDDADDPTEIELDPPAAPNPMAPMVRAKWDTGNGVPLPPEGDTRTFSASQLKENRHYANANAQSQPVASIGPAAHAMPSPGATMDPQAFAPSPIAAQGPAKQPHRPAPTMGIRPPSSPPPAAAAAPAPAAAPAVAAPRPAAPQPMAPAPASPAHAPIPGLGGAAPMPTQPPPQDAAFRSTSVLPKQSPPQPALGLPGGHHMAGASGQDKQFQLLEKRRVQMASLWSGIFALAALALFLLPLGTLSRAKINPKQASAILLNESVHKRYFGYNKHDQLHTHQVVFQFLYRNGRIHISYRVSSPDPVEVLLNGQHLTRIEPTKKRWHYDRRLLPRSKLRPYYYNRLLFRRVSNKRGLKVWGITQVKKEEQPFPAPDLSKAKRYCDHGHKLYRSKDKDPSHSYKALQQFTQCQNFLALLNNPPPLYKTATLMLSQINRELDLQFHQMLQKASKTSDPTRKMEIYQQLKRYFPDKQDPRHQQIAQLQQKR